MKKSNVDTSVGPVVVGIGASAGGLEALQEFFKNLPTDTGLAFVVIQHLSPDYRSLMDELLARETDIPIHIAEDGMLVEANSIYLIPPRKNITLFSGQLYLEDQGKHTGLNLPVDIFFRSLAQERGSDAVGIILSGTGSDGTLGTRAIKEAGGLVMVQDEKSAKFNGMPKSCTSAVSVDSILPPSEMPGALIEFLKHPLVQRSRPPVKEPENMNTLGKILHILRDYGGIDFSFYKENTVIRRLERRISINRFNSMEEYLSLLLESDREKDILNRELLIGVTRFFRDQDAFDALKREVFPVLATRKSIRIWSAACSTGEEAYSIAILLSEYLEEHGLSADIKIFATDIDRFAVEYAGKGFYPDSVMADVDSILLAKYFVKVDGGYLIRESIRRMIVFARHNLLKDSPFSKLDLMICRNLFIYIKPNMQSKILSMLYYSIQPKGFLFMGSSETIGEMGTAFDTVDSKWKIFKYRDGYKPNLSKDIPLFHSSMPRDILTSASRYSSSVKYERIFEVLANDLLPPSILVDENDNIHHVINDLAPFLKVQPGRFSQNIFTNLLPELGLFVSTLLRRLRRDEDSFIFEHLKDLPGYETKRLTLQGRRVLVDKNQYYLLSFILSEEESKKQESENVSSASVTSAYDLRVEELERELQFTKENLQATVEELETSNEELQSSNEELIASNEELQSTNEELQSVNEELYTVNSEYQLKIEELTRLNGDVTNLLNNTEVGALYLDRNLCIRKITPLVSKVTNILDSDMGRPISHISLDGFSPSLQDDIQSVLNTLQPHDSEVELPNGSWLYQRIRPYRTEYNAVDGILVTFVDISEVKLQNQRADWFSRRLAAAQKLAEVVWWEADCSTGQIISDARRANILGHNADSFPRDLDGISVFVHQSDRNEYIKSMKKLLSGEIEEWSMRYRCCDSKGDWHWFQDRAIRVTGDGSEPDRVSGALIDGTDFHKMSLEIGFGREFFENLMLVNPVAQTVLDSSGSIVYANPAAENLLQLKRSEIEDRLYDDPRWRIEDINGDPIDSADLPFGRISATKQGVANYKHWIISENGRTLLNICGNPVFDPEGAFIGAVFTMEACNDGES